MPSSLLSVLLRLSIVCGVLVFFIRLCEISTPFSSQVQFQTKVYPEKVEIYETYNAGAVKRLQFLQPNSKWLTAWETTTMQHIQKIRVFSPTFEVSFIAFEYSNVFLYICFASSKCLLINIVFLLFTIN